MKIFIKTQFEKTFILEGLQMDDKIGDIILKISEIKDEKEFHAGWINLIYGGAILSEHHERSLKD